MPQAQFRLTADQERALELLTSSARHIMLYGGSRSGKTLLLCYAIMLRAVQAPGSRHVVLRHRYAHVMQSVWYDTWPKMMRLCFPAALDEACDRHKADGFIRLANGAEIWLAGLDDKQRTEKI